MITISQKNGSAFGVRPNQRFRLVQCQQCHYTHLIPPDCPVEPVCPYCLYTPVVERERREDRREMLTLILSVAIGMVAWGLVVWALVRWWPWIFTPAISSTRRLC